ncbi:MAG TPA: MarR family transcriptional regulator [Candidatus Eremiobacteraceae bacterium]|nr:MarR family transcriptional regulator [Candidatus Eremiobacteraceae bacterium]
MSKVKNKNIAPRQETLAAADGLHSAAIHLLRRVRKQDHATGVGPAQLSALSVLVFAGPKTLGELAAAEQVKPPTMSRIVAGLERSLLIEITRDPEDARRMHIRSSSKGASLLQQARRRRIESLASHLSILAPVELATLNRAVDILKNVLDAWH